jgi:hypothetical protein
MSCTQPPLKPSTTCGLVSKPKVKISPGYLLAACM